MNKFKEISRTRAQESSNAIERLYITMRHLFNRGFYKPMGVSGKSLREALLSLRPEIYGSIAEEKMELNGLIYIIDRLPIGIEECRYINLTSDEGYAQSHFEVIVPPKRRRNCYRIDEEQMNIEITRGRSEIYDILTHLTFLFIESEKIKDRVLLDDKGSTTRDWDKIKDVVYRKKKLTQKQREIAISHLANVVGRTFEEIIDIYDEFAVAENPERFLHIVYHIGQLAIEEEVSEQKRTITFSPILRERIGHHIHGEIWANTIKERLEQEGLLGRPIHIISANMHSVMNSLYVPIVFEKELKKKDIIALFEEIGKSESKAMQSKIEKYAEKNGMIRINDTSGANINVQIIDTLKINFSKTNYELTLDENGEAPVIFVMDYAFGEQAYETMDEFLKPYTSEKGEKTHMNVHSVSIMGKAGILEGGKGDIMIPTSHIYEGTADNYPFENQLEKEDLEGYGMQVFDGAMVTVLGTSLQNKDILAFFHDSTWNVIGLEMEGAHYQKAIQAASQIRGNVRKDIKVTYAYYASDNPLETGSTLASGGLGMTGVRPTYVITRKILEKIF